MKKIVLSLAILLLTTSAYAEPGLPTVVNNEYKVSQENDVKFSVGSDIILYESDNDDAWFRDVEFQYRNVRRDFYGNNGWELMLVTKVNLWGKIKRFFKCFYEENSS